MSDVFDKDDVLHMNINEAYSVLGLTPGASQAEVKQAYRELVKIWHPDRFSDRKQKQEAEEKIKLINEAYNKLKFYQPTYTKQPSQAQHRKVSAHRFDAESFYNRGVENAQLGRYNEAIDDFTHAIRLNPNYIEAYKYRGHICSILGYEHRANSDLDKAANLEGKLYQQQGSSASSSRHPTSSKRKSKPKSLIGRFFHWIKSLLGFDRRYR